MGKGESFIQEYLVLGSVIGLCLALCYKEVPWSMEPNEVITTTRDLLIIRAILTDIEVYSKMMSKAILQYVESYVTIRMSNQTSPAHSLS